MAEKKALLILANGNSFDGNGAGIAKLLKKAAIFNSYEDGDIIADFIPSDGTLTIQPEEIAENIEKGTAVMLIHLNQMDQFAFDAALETVIEGTDRKTVIAVVTSKALALYGNGINAKAGTIDRVAKAADVIPTLAYIADFPITDSCTGAILYQALKNPNLKRDEIAKLKEALVRMEGALARDNREPWDKHDCA